VAGWLRRPIGRPSVLSPEVPEQDQLDAAKAGVQFVLPSSGMTDMDFVMYTGCFLKKQRSQMNDSKICSK